MSWSKNVANDAGRSGNELVDHENQLLTYPIDQNLIQKVEILQKPLPVHRVKALLLRQKQVGKTCPYNADGSSICQEMYYFNCVIYHTVQTRHAAYLCVR